MPETLEVTMENFVTDTQETSENTIEERKRQIAYQLWEDEGRPEGRAETHWEKACLVVMSLDAGDVPAAPEWLKRSEEIQGADRKSTRLNSSHPRLSRMPSSA